MLFNSVNFIVFFIVVFFIYWFVVNKNLRQQNAMLVIASYYFYCCWDWRFGFLLAFSTLLDFFSGIAIAGSENRKKMWLTISIGINLGCLMLFKYFNFFAESFTDLLNVFGLHASYTTLNILLPIGISFYTFHGLSYVLDVYNSKIKPTRNVIDYALFVSFFPLLVAGPIERATHLLPQIQKPRTFNYERGVDGLKQIVWGFFKKLVIADNCAVFVNIIFGHHEAYNGSALVLGAVFFSFQVYGDFSGYTDIALGVGRLIGFDLLKNFNYPYFSRDMAEFWRRWHISLSSWFRDYLYIPLGGSKGGMFKKIRNIFIIFIVSGLWHGARYTYIVWGALHALFLLPSLFNKRSKTYIQIVAAGKLLPTAREFIAMVVTFMLTTLAQTVFRSKDMGHAVTYISGMFSTSVFKIPNFPYRRDAAAVIVLIIVFMIVEWIGREHDYAIQNAGRTWNRPLRWVMYSFIIFSIFMFMETEGTRFIYFKF